jgi:hypothetical protein
LLGSRLYFGQKENLYQGINKDNLTKSTKSQSRKGSANAGPFLLCGNQAHFSAVIGEEMLRAKNYMPFYLLIYNHLIKKYAIYSVSVQNRSALPRTTAGMQRAGKGYICREISAGRAADASI